MQAANPAAIVIEDTLNVYAKPSTNSPVLHPLRRDDTVSLDFSSIGDGGVSWCGVTFAPDYPPPPGTCIAPAYGSNLRSRVLSRHLPMP